MSYFYLNQIITSTLISNREYTSSSKTPFNSTNFYKTQKYVLLTRQYVITNVKYTKLPLMSILINREYIVTPIIPIGGYLKLNRNKFVYNTTI